MTAGGSQATARETSGPPDAAAGRGAWVLRPVVLFAAGYALLVVPHELAHALTARAVGVPATLFQFGVNLARDRGGPGERALIGAAGPLVSLALGLVFWLAYRRAGGRRAGLPLLYMAVFGAATFCGNLMSAAFVGDFSRVAVALGWPAPVRYALSVTGLLSLCGLIFLAGRELRVWAPAGAGRFRAALGMVLLPAAAGTTLATLLSLPLPPGFTQARLAEAAFWLCGVAGAAVGRKLPSGERRTLRTGWADVALLAVAALALRVMARGIVFGP
jgi:hypothetical protein